MSIIQITTNFAGQVDVHPRLVRVVSSDDFDTITGVNYLAGHGIISTDFVCVSYSDGQAIFTPIIDASGNITLSQQPQEDGLTTTSTAGQTTSVTANSATPGTIRALTGAIQDNATPMTSGNLVGLRGEVTNPAAKIVSGGFLYGVQGKAIVQGTLSGSSWTAAIFGQLNIDTATLSGGQIACLWGDAGTTGPASVIAAANMVRLTNTTPTTFNAILSAYGKASFYFDGQLNGSAWFANAGTGAGSAGDTTKCNATKVLAIQIDGVPYWVPAFAQNT